MPSTTLGKNNHNYLISWNTVSFNTVILLIRCHFLLTEKGQEFVNSIQLRVSEKNIAVSIAFQDNGKLCIYICHNCICYLKKILKNGTVLFFRVRVFRMDFQRQKVHTHTNSSRQFLFERKMAAGQHSFIHLFISSK